MVINLRPFDHKTEKFCCKSLQYNNNFALITQLHEKN